MKNWSTDTSRLKRSSKQYTIWKLEQLINFGLDDEKISKRDLIKYWDSVDIDPQKRRYLATILWEKAS